VHVRRTGNRSQLLGELLGGGERHLLGAGRADDLQIHRRRQAEVQDLRRDVGRQKEERGPGVARGQLLAQGVDVALRRRMVGLERDEHLPVRGRNQRALAERQVDAAVGHADVVDQRDDLVGRDDAADRLLDLQEIPFGLLDARAGRAAHVQLDEPGVDRGEKIPPDQRK
jgi:hypothetical protein